MSGEGGARIRVGISGWRYAAWRGAFYPKGLPQRAELAHAAGHFSTIELNGSFYSLQRPQSYASWYGETPADFVFAVKGPRYITHMKRLRDIERAAANFFASGVFNLRAKLGPILWQFPTNFRYQRELMADARKISARPPPGTRRRDVYCFFDNTDVKLRAPYDAQALIRKLAQPRGARRLRAARPPGPGPRGASHTVVRGP